MASSGGGAMAAAASSGDGSSSGGSCQKKTMEAADGAQRGGESFMSPNVRESEEAYVEEEDLIAALTNTGVTASCTVDEVMIRANEFFSIAGFDEPSLLLVTKKLMDNMLRKKPDVMICNIGLTEKVAEKLSTSRYVVREKNNTNLMASRWDQKKLIVHPIMSGETVDTLVPIDFPRTVKIKDISEAVYQLLSAENIQEEMTDDFDLRELPEEKAIEVLASGFVKTGADYVDEIIKQSLTGHNSSNKNQLREKLLELKSHADKVAYVREMGLVKDTDFRVVMQNMMIGDLVSVMIKETKKSLETALVSYALVSESINKRETTNCRLFSFSCVGSALIKAKVGTSKSFKLSVDNTDYLSQIIISLRCLENKGRTSILKLEVIGDVMLEQRSVVRLYSSLYRSTGIIDATTDEVISIQDDVFDGFITAELIDFADTTEDYTVTNASSLVPMMVLGGIIPDNLEDPATNICWQISLRSVVNNLCRLNRVFDMSIDRNHFLFNFKTALVIAGGLEDILETKKFIVQFFLWARFVDKLSNLVYTDYYVNSLINKKKNKSASGLGAQCLWTASALLEVNEICETGYKYLPIIIFYNMLCSGEYSAKLVNMGVWLANSLSLNVNRVVEDRGLMDTMEKLGMLVSVDWKRRLAMLPDIGSKIMVTIEMMREQMCDIAHLVADTNCTKVEAALLCKFALMSLDMSDSASGKTTEGFVSDIASLVINKMKKSAEQGEMSNEDYLMLIKEIARDMEDDDEIKQVLNTEGTKYHVICDKLFEKKEKIANAIGSWKRADVGEAPSSLRRKEMERQLLKDFTNQTIAFSERARNNAYQLTEFNSSTMRDTLNLNGAIITSFLHRMGSLGGKDINILLSTLAGKGVEGASASLNADDINVFSISNVDTNVSIRGESSSQSSTTKLTLLEGFSVTVGISKTFDLTKMLEAIDRLTKKKSTSSVKLKQLLDNREATRQGQLAQLEDGNGREMIISASSDNGQIISAYFSSLAQEFKECFDIMEFEGDEPAFKTLRSLMLSSAGLPMSILNCATVIVRRLLDLVWDSVTYLYDEIDETSKEAEKKYNEAGQSRARKAAKLSMETLKVALSTALISYKMTFTTYFNVAEGSISLIKRLSVKSGRKLYMLVEKELVSSFFFFGISTDVNRMRKYVCESRRAMCEHVAKYYSLESTDQPAIDDKVVLSKVESIICTATKPVRVTNRLVVSVVNRVHNSYTLLFRKLAVFFSYVRNKVSVMYRHAVDRAKKNVTKMMSSFKATSNIIKNSLVRSAESVEERKRQDKGKNVLEDKNDDGVETPFVSACGMQDTRASGVSSPTVGETGVRNELGCASTAQDVATVSEETTFDGVSPRSEPIPVGVDTGTADRIRSNNDEAVADNNQAVLRIKIQTENRFLRFARVMATRILLVGRILFEEWVDTIEDVMYLIFSRAGYTNRYNIIRLSTELDTGSLRDYERRMAAEAAKSSFYFKTFKAVYRFCQKTHGKFVDFNEYTISFFSKIKTFCREFLANGIENIRLVATELRARIEKRNVGANDAAAETERKIRSATRCSVNSNPAERSTSAQSFADRSMYESEECYSVFNERDEGREEFDNASIGVDESVSKWLMLQDERSYEPYEDNLVESTELQASKEAYQSYFQSELHNSNSKRKDATDARLEEDRRSVQLDAIDTVHNNAGDDFESQIGDDEHKTRNNAIAQIANELKDRISEVVWMNETNKRMRRDFVSMRGINWIFSSVEGTDGKHLLRYVGEEDFDKLVVITGNVNEAALNSIETRLDMMVIQKIGDGLNTNKLMSTVRDIESRFGVTMEVVDEAEANDKLAEIIAREFESKISRALRGTGEITSRWRVRDVDMNARVAGSEIAVNCNNAVITGDIETTDERAAIGVVSGIPKLETDTDLAEKSHVVYEESPMSRMLSRLASIAGFDSSKGRRRGENSSAERKFGLEASRSARGLRLALTRSASEGEGDLGVGDKALALSDRRSEDSEEEARLTVRLTGNEDSTSLTSEMVKLLTRSLKDRVLNYAKSWVEPTVARKDNIVVEVIERPGQLSREDMREIRLRGNASFAPVWDSLADVLNISVECDSVKEESNLIEIFGKKKLLKHGKQHNNIKYLIKNEIDIVDAGDVSILCIPELVSTMRENLLVRGKYVSKGGDEYTCTMKSVCDISVGKSYNKVMRGKSCVVTNENLGLEMLMVPRHLNAYGSDGPSGDTADALDCLAIADSKSTWRKTPEQLKQEVEIGDEHVTMSGILARKEFDTSSKFFSLASVDAVDWRGKSGAPIVDYKGKFLGILLMQITDGKYYDVLNGAGVVICAKPDLSPRLIMHSMNVRVAKCFCCRTGIGKQTNSDQKYKLSESSSSASKRSWSKRMGELGDSSADACLKCAELNNDDAARDSAIDALRPITSRRSSEICDECKKKKGEQSNAGRLEQGKRMLWAGLNYLTGRDSDETNASNNDSDIRAVKTGALERIGEVLSSERRNYRIDVGASDDVVIHNISEILYYSERGCEDNFSTIVLEFLLEQLVKGRKPVVVSSTNTCHLTIMLLLSSLRLRFDRVRSVSDLQRACCVYYKKTRTSVVIINNEDIACSVLSKDKLSLSNQHHKVSCLVLTSDNEAVKNCSLASLKMLSLFLTNMTVIMYDCRKRSNVTDESSNTSMEKMICIETKRMDSYQNCGVFHHLQLSNALIEMAEMNGLGEDNEDGEIRYIVITMCSGVRDYNEIRNRLSKATEVNGRSILVTNHSAFASKQLWEVVKTCKNIFLHTGTKATYANDLIVNCSLETNMASSERCMFLEAYRIASKLALGGDYREDPAINVVTLMDMNSEARVDKNWFLVDYRASNTFKEYNAHEFIKKTNHTFIEGNTIVQIVSVIENKFKTLRTDDREIKMMLTDEDLINENLILNKKIRSPLSTILSVKMDKCASSLKWAWHNITISALVFVRKLKDSIMRMLRRSKYIFKSKVLRSMTRMKKVGKEVINRALSSLKVNKTASYFNQNNGGGDASGVSKFLSSLCRCAGLANAAACIAGYKKNKFSDEKKIDNSIMALMVSAGFEAISSNLTDGVRITCESVGNLIATITVIGEITYLVLGWKKNLIIGNWRFSSCGLSANKVVVSKFSHSLNLIKQEMNSIEVVQTGLILDDVRTGCIDATTYLNMYELGLSLYEVVRKLWLSVRLSWLFSNLRKGIEHRNDNPFPTQRSVEVVPCYEVGPAVASVILIGTTGILALSLALRRVETAISTIAVITEKKHTYDMVEVYKRDRDLGAILFRAANIGYGIFLLSTGGQASCIVGAAGICLGVADIVVNSFSELGVCYSLSHILVRMYTARNKIRAAVNGWSAWYGGSSTVANGVNALIITGHMLGSEEGSVSEAAMNNIKLMMALAQNKERLANGVLMDKSVKAAVAYDNAKTIVLGRKSIDDLSDASKWDHELGASAELLDLNLIANRGLGSRDWSDSRLTQVELGGLTINQCRFVGRTKKLLKFDKQMVPDEMIEHQSSVLALHDDLWKDVVSDADREGWGAAGDSRYAVLLAIAERNDSPIVLDIDVTLMEKMTLRGIELINKIIPSILKVESKVKSLDWLTIVSNINERATSGILTRLRTGQQVTAGYLPNYGYRSELLCEMMHDGTMPDECSIINVFAKRRVEKKKRSRLTGVECVITRTIQANEVDLKVACAGSFVMLDKLIKLSKCYNGLAIGLNFFIEFAVDELNTSTECYRKREDHNIRRISLDHSSFDSSQRNWSIVLCRELRILANEIMMLNSKSDIKEANDLIRNIYDGLLIRLMLTTHGDLFAVTGQQMSGHATTSSDNSIKAYLYAMVTCDLMKKSFSCELIEDSLRAQGDDTKFDIVINNNEVSDSEISASISKAMSKLGQVVKSEKIEISKIGESSGFLSNKCGLSFFIMRRRTDVGEAWYESHLIPVRRRRDLIAMLATILKSSSNKTKRKTKKNISLLAAKSMSFLTMYVGDALIARVCVTVIWICFKALTEFKNVSSKMDITSTHLPWFVEQSGIEGEFEIKLYELMSMHGIARKELGIIPEFWLIDKSDPDYDMINLPQKLMRNARAAFPAVRDWMDDDLLNAIKVKEVEGNNRLVKICVASVDEQLNRIKDGLTLAIIDATVPYEPFNRLKRKVKENRTFVSNLGLKKVFIISARQAVEKTICENALKRMEKPVSEETLRINLTTKDGLVIKGMELRVMTCKDYKIGVVDDEIKARMIEVSPWNVINLVCVKEENLEAVITLGKKYSSFKNKDIILTDLNLLNSHRSAKELNDDLNRALEGVSLERLSRLKLLINDDNKTTVRSVLIVRDKLWWKP